MKKSGVSRRGFPKRAAALSLPPGHPAMLDSSPTAVVEPNIFATSPSGAEVLERFKSTQRYDSQSHQIQHGFE